MPTQLKSRTGRWGALAGAVAIVLALLWALLPQPVDVDLAAISRAPLNVTIDEEGKTRIRDVFVITAPVAGTLRRTDLKAGDAVVRDETTIAIIKPPPPTFRDVRTGLELEAQVKSCEANVQLAEAELRQALAEQQLAKSEFERTLKLSEKGVAAQSALEKSQTALATRDAAVTRAKAAIEVRRRELETARARQAGPEQTEVRQATASACSFEVKAPESGRVLKLIAESEQPIASGAPVMEIGDPANLEIVVELLSADAVKVKPGSKAIVEGWGGPPLNAHVKSIEPSGFTKVSALGIEEQRVKTILALDDPPSVWQRLGHDYRVFVRIAVYSAPSALTVPLGALFRSGEEWSVFVVDRGRAQVANVKLGERNTVAAEIVEGLKEGDAVILHPSDRVAGGVRVRERPEAE